MHRNTHLIAALTLALQGLALPVAAEVVLYDNSHGDFAWLPQTSTGAPFNYYDPTQPATQSGEQTPSGLTHTSLFPETSTGIAVNSIGAGGGIEIAVEDSFTVHGSEGSQATVTPAKTFRLGEAVGPAADWANGADHYWRANVDGRVPLLGGPPIIGFRTETNGQHQYGWIELGLRMFEAPHFGLHYQPIRWAYETELNTPITVPITAIPSRRLSAPCFFACWPGLLWRSCAQQFSDEFVCQLRFAQRRPGHESQQSFDDGGDPRSTSSCISRRGGGDFL